ncbi:hypothetical protein [Flavobacterium suzhouense]|uniref:PH (Pleckstrin Homology) domain-containing protein n=1 Tax=Flavobacterium suzhouense TaxID=1529638 RepID=A0ABW5NX90_9FLAO
MSKDLRFYYIDKYSILIMGLLFVLTVAISVFFFFLGSFCYVIGSLYFILFVSRINHIVLLNNKFLLVKYLIHFRWISIQDVQLIKCELTGFGRSRDVVIYVYYIDEGNKLKKALFLHFRVLGYKNIVSFLNNIQSIVDIDEESFGIVGITKRDGVYKN